MMSTNSYGRGRRSSSDRSHSIGPLSPMMREKRTLDVVKSVLTKVKERVLSSGPLTTDEDTAISQLEQLFVNRFSHGSQESDIGKLIGDGKGNGSGQCFPPSSILISSRRDSDASFSNDTHSSCFLSTYKPQTPKSRERDYYGCRDPWRRQWQRRKRLELRGLVEPLPLRVDEANGACLVRAVASIYDDLLLQGKPPLAAYDLLITTLRSHFARETWPDLVDPYVVQFVQNHVLLSAADIDEKYSNGLHLSFRRVEECKLQSLLHLFALPATNELRGEKLDEVIELLRPIAASADGVSVLHKFLDEDVLETFLEIMPRDLIRLYQETNISLPAELSVATPKGSGKDKAGADAKGKQQPEAVPWNFALPRKKGRPRKTDVRPIITAFQKSAPLKTNLNGVKKGRPKRRLDDIEEVVEPKAHSEESTPQGRLKIQATRTPTMEEPKREKAPAMEEAKVRSVKKTTAEEQDVKPSKALLKKTESSTGNQQKKLKPSDSHPVAKVIAESSDASAVLVSVRQSPRHHASTRALYGSASNTISLMLQKEQTDGADRNGCLAVPTTTTSELLNDSTRLVLVKDKRGYFLKKFLHEGNNDSEESAAGVPSGMPSKNSPSKKSVGVKKEIPSLKNGQQKDQGKVVEKLTLKLKKTPPKKTAMTPQQTSSIGTAPPATCSAKKTSNGRKVEGQRIVITKVKSPGDSKPSFVLSTSPASRGRNGKNEKRQSSVGSGRSEQSSAAKAGTKSSKSASVNSDKREPAPSKSVKPKSVTSEKRNLAYTLPAFAVENYVKHVNELRRERKRARFDPADGIDLFYARGTRRHSIYYDGDDGGGVRSHASKCYSDEQMAPKNRSGRKMKSSVEVFHLANYLLNIQNENPTTPAVPKNLQQALNTPIRLYRKLRLAPKNSRRRSLRQFCALKFNADEFKLSLDSGSGTSNSSMADEEPSANDADECASLELNCGEPPMTSPNEDSRRHDMKMTLTINTRLLDASPRRNSVSVCAGLARSPPKTWTVNGAVLNGQEAHSEMDQKNGYYLRRRRLFSDGHVCSKGVASMISPTLNGVKRSVPFGRRGEEFEVAKKKFKELRDGINESGMIFSIGSPNGTVSRAASSAVQETEFYMIADESICGHLLDRRVHTRSVDGEETDGPFLNRLSSHAGGLLQLANPSSLICGGLGSKNYAQSQVTADVR